ncbi:hypothetical protein N9B55_01370, partial [Vicingaceae bacterium]|nr:hypothetical protein [Vicingaceae bacterium]
DNGASLTFNGSDTLSILGDLSNSGTISANNGTIAAVGLTEVQNFTTSPGADVSFNNLYVNNSLGLLLGSGEWSITNNLQVTSGYLDVTNSDETILASSSSKTSQILPSVNNAFVGDFTIQRFIGGRNSGYSNIASPIKNGTFSDLDDDLKISGAGGINGNAFALGGGSGSIFYSLLSYNSLEDKHDTITNITTSMTPTTGYEVYLYNTLPTFNPTTVDFIGVPNVGNINLATYSIISQGWNLIGNPYHSFINWNSVSSAIPSLRRTYYIYNTNSGSYDLKDNVNDPIAPGQAFWVNQPNTGGYLPTFKEEHKVNSNSSAFLRTKRDNLFSLELSNDKNFFTNKVEIGFNYSATSSIDQLDAMYLQSPHKNASELYTKTTSSHKLIRNILNSSEKHHLIQLELKVGEPTNYHIKTKNITTLLEDYSCIYLNDNKTGELVDLSLSPNYTFEASTGVTNRFELIVSNSFKDCEVEMNKSIIQKFNSEMNLRESYGEWYLDYNLGELGTQRFKVSVYALNGKLVLPASEINLSEHGTYKLQGLTKLDGVFVIQIVGQNNILNKKIKL